MGVVVDTFGRKIPLVLAFITTGSAIAAIPMFTEIYPWFLVMRVVIGLGQVIIGNVPLMPDYVEYNSLGKASSYSEIVKNLAAIFASSGLYQLVKAVPDLSYIYYGLGAFSFFLALFMIYGIKDVIAYTSRSRSLEFL